MMPQGAYYSNSKNVVKIIDNLTFDKKLFIFYFTKNSLQKFLLLYIVCDWFDFLTRSTQLE